MKNRTFVAPCRGRWVLMVLSFFFWTSALLASSDIPPPFEEMRLSPEAQEIVDQLREQHRHQSIIVHFFSYGCAACYRIYPTVERFRAGVSTEIAWESVPVVFHPDWALYSRLFYTLKSIGQERAMSAPLYACAQDRQNPCRNKEAAFDVLKAAGLPVEEARLSFQDPALETQLRRVEAWPAVFKLHSIPSFILIPARTDKPVLLFHLRSIVCMDSFIKEVIQHAQC